MNKQERNYPTRMHEILMEEREMTNQNRKQENHNYKNHDPANQCVVCGNEMPEGDQVCKLCREQEEREMTPEERLLKAIFAKDDSENEGPDGEMPDNYPETYFEKADYALFCLHKVLGCLSPALGRISRLCGLLRIGEKDGKNTLPDIITHSESRMALRHLIMVKRDVDDAYQQILSIFENTKEPGTVAKTERVEQGPEPGVEVE